MLTVSLESFYFSLYKILDHRRGHSLADWSLSDMYSLRLPVHVGKFTLVALAGRIHLVAFQRLCLQDLGGYGVTITLIKEFKYVFLMSF